MLKSPENVATISNPADTQIVTFFETIFGAPLPDDSAIEIRIKRADGKLK
jgi:hypothetical protein